MIAYVFCHEDGRWLNTKKYDSFFRKLCQKLNLNVTNNHALRMSFNSNVLIPNGVSVADRAKLLGHSVETNLRHYSFAQKDYMDSVRDILDSLNDREQKEAKKEHNYTIAFKHKESPQTANL